jgi:hypothetical protein
MPAYYYKRCLLPSRLGLNPCNDYTEPAFDRFFSISVMEAGFVSNDPPGHLYLPIRAIAVNGKLT